MEKVKNDIKENLTLLREDHQIYMDILESFCKSSANNIKELNDAYLYIVTKIDKDIKSSDLERYGIIRYKPFKGDLYTAESEWDSINIQMAYSGGPMVYLNWDTIKPYLYETHSKITSAINEVNTDNTVDHSKKIEEIKKILRKDDDEQIFYITKDGDDFKYKGKVLNLSKNTDTYKVFCTLYARLSEGGEISYTDLISELESRMKISFKTKEEATRFIQRNLTDTNNGVLKSANIPLTQDNGKPLIAVVRGTGIVFNNKAG